MELDLAYEPDTRYEDSYNTLLTLGLDPEDYVYIPREMFARFNYDATRMIGLRFMIDGKECVIFAEDPIPWARRIM